MAMPALSVGAGTAPVLDVENVLLRLPAEARARVAWARKPIEEALAELRSGPLTDALVAEAADRIVTPLHAISRAAWVAFAANADEYRAALMQDFQREESRLSAFVATDAARDTLS